MHRKITGRLRQASILNNAGPGRLSGTLTVPVVLGLAWFTDLSIDVWGTGYTLSFFYAVTILSVRTPGQKEMYPHETANFCPRGPD